MSDTNIPLPPQMGAHVFRNETQLAEQHFDRLQKGGPVAVKVCRPDPANHQVVGERARGSRPTAALSSSAPVDHGSPLYFISLRAASCRLEATTGCALTVDLAKRNTGA
jgi:hypothetical protein